MLTGRSLVDVERRVRPELAVVWGNCQAAPLADLLRAPLAAAGLTVVDVPPVFLASEDEIAQAHRLVGRAALLISHPIRENYRFGGCGTTALAAQLPPRGRLVTIPTIFHDGPFPYLVNAHGADGARVDAPITDYHDLRAIQAAADGLTTDQAVAGWSHADPDLVRSMSADSIERLRRRESDLDIVVSDLVGDPDALWSMNHPSNRVLVEVARRVLDVAGVGGEVQAPTREFLAEKVAPIDTGVAAALGWPESAARSEWQIRGRAVADRDVLAAHLDFYGRRPDVVTDSLRRYATRLAR